MKKQRKSYFILIHANIWMKSLYCVGTKVKNKKSGPLIRSITVNTKFQREKKKEERHWESYLKILLFNK